MNEIRAMLFDLDGTLLDSAPDLVASLNWVRQTEGMPPLRVCDMRKYASRGALGLLLAGMPTADAATVESWRLRFLEHYAQNSFRDTAPYDGIGELLQSLFRAQMPWGIVTNKIESLTHPIVAAAQWSKLVSCVVCGDTLNHSKPHPAPVLRACELLGVLPAQTIFVGDDVRDIQAGRAAGCQTAAVFYGYGSHELEDQDVAGSFPVHHPLDLVALIKQSEGTSGGESKDSGRCPSKTYEQ
ncbi:MAG: HAD-IA family hydrolase [Xanthomonadales bacterium]|nr:HAD-IA family hydrolase [Xanthomonadales bacterium]